MFASVLDNTWPKCISSGIYNTVWCPHGILGPHKSGEKLVFESIRSRCEVCSKRDCKRSSSLISSSRVSGHCRMKFGSNRDGGVMSFIERRWKMVVRSTVHLIEVPYSDCLPLHSGCAQIYSVSTKGSPKIQEKIWYIWIFSIWLMSTSPRSKPIGNHGGA